MTPSQLERKRANDREAQRAIRARTKDRIDQLESEVKRLRSITDRDHEWQRMVRRLQFLEEENKALKAGLHIPPSEAYNRKLQHQIPNSPSHITASQMRFAFCHYTSQTVRSLTALKPSMTDTHHCTAAQSITGHLPTAIPSGQHLIHIPATQTCQRPLQRHGIAPFPSPFPLQSRVLPLAPPRTTGGSPYLS